MRIFSNSKKLYERNNKFRVNLTNGDNGKSQLIRNEIHNKLKRGGHISDLKIGGFF